MSGLTNEIEQFLLELLDQCGNESLEIGRNDLAERFNCAPSQINYVLTTRFTPYQGYYIESRRGGSGYIRIIRLSRNPDQLIKSLYESESTDSLTAGKVSHILQSLFKQGIIDERELALMAMGTDDQALRSAPLERRNELRAQIFKNMLLVFLS